MTLFFKDTFSGSGTLNGHAPDTPLGAEVWANDPDGLTRSGGYAQAIDQTIGGPGGSASTGDGVGPYTGAWVSDTINFLIHTGADVSFTAGRNGANVVAAVNGVYFQAQLKCDATSSWVFFDGTTEVPVTIAANTTYTASIAIADTVQTYTFDSVPLITGAQSFVDSSGVTQVAVVIGDQFGVGELDVGFDVPVGHGVANMNIPNFIVDGAGAYAGYCVLPAFTTTGYTGGAGAFSIPVLTVTGIAHDATGERAANVVLPSLTLSAYGGANAIAALPMLSVSATGTVVVLGEVTATLPLLTVSATGTVSGMGTAAAKLPAFDMVGYSGAVLAVSVGSFSMLASGTSGLTGRGAVTLPMFDVAAVGVGQNHGAANLILPALTSPAHAQAWMVLPGFTLTAIGTATITATYEAYALNLKHTDPTAQDELTRYTNFPFTHVVRYKNSYFGVSSGALYLLEGTTDNTTPIPFNVKTATTDFGAPEQKTVQYAYFGGRMGAASTVSITAGEATPVSYSYATPRGPLAQNYRQPFGRGIKARYFSFGVSGSDVLEIDSIDLDVLTLKRRI